MNDFGSYLVSFLGGAALGVVFFGGLWLTIKKVQETSHQARLLVGSFFGRSLITLAGFFLIANGHLERLLAAFLGFILVRVIMYRRLRPKAPLGKGVNAHATES